MLETVWYELASRSGGWLSVVALAALKAAVILALAGVVAFALRGASAAVRHQVWLIGVVCALAVPLLGAVLPDIRVPGPSWLAASREAAPGRAPVIAVPTVLSPAAVQKIEARAAAAAARAEEAAARASERLEMVAGRLDGARALTMAEAARAEAVAAATAAAGRVRISIPEVVTPMPAPAPIASVVLPPPGFFPEPVEWSGADVDGFPWAVPLLALWLLGVWVVTAGIMAGALRVAWIGWQAKPVASGRCATLAQAIADELGLRNVRVLLGPSTAMPMTWGIFRTTVLLPEGAEDWPVDQLDAALRHEMAHARRRDTLTQLIADLGCAIYWFNPLAWLAAHRLRIEREHACDDEVLASGSKPSDYATQLLDMTRALRAARLTAMAAIPMARPSQLRDRLEAVLDENRSRGRLSRPARARGWAAGFLLALPLAMLGFTPMASFADTQSFRFEYDHDYDYDHDIDVNVDVHEVPAPAHVWAGLPGHAVHDSEVSGDLAAELIRVAASLIESDSEKAELLQRLADSGIEDAEVQRAYIEAAASIGSDRERRRAIEAILEQSDLDADVVTLTIEAATEIGLDSEKAAVLLRLARTQELDDVARAAFIDAIATISSDREQERVSAEARTRRKR